jgi:hypothetical protein
VAAIALFTGVSLPAFDHAWQVLVLGLTFVLIGRQFNIPKEAKPLSQTFKPVLYVEIENRQNCTIV